LLELEAKKQNRYCSRTWYQATRKAEHDDLACGYIPVGKAAFNVVGMSQLMRILVA
jgi:hypothetical protein